MTKAELIEALKDVPDSRELVVLDRDGDPMPLTRVLHERVFTWKEQQGQLGWASAEFAHPSCREVVVLT